MRYMPASTWMRFLYAIDATNVCVRVSVREKTGGNDWTARTGCG